MKSVIHEQFKSYKSQIDEFINEFDDLGTQFGKADRNTIKLFNLDGKTINIKSFKTPNIINQIVYKIFRKSKAQRSFEYANKLIDLGVKSPKPIAYYELSNFFLFKKSFYVSDHLLCDLTYRELIHNFNYPDYDAILRAFTRFTFKLHEKGINFLDHSPGNTLIKKVGNSYEFYLVDLNRMKFELMSFDERMKNFARLTKYKEMVEVMGDEYAKVSNEPYKKVFDAMWHYTIEFREKFERKKRIKKKLKFWKVRA